MQVKLETTILCHPAAETSCRIKTGIIRANFANLKIQQTEETLQFNKAQYSHLFAFVLVSITYVEHLTVQLQNATESLPTGC